MQHNIFTDVVNRLNPKTIDMFIQMNLFHFWLNNIVYFTHASHLQLEIYVIMARNPYKEEPEDDAT